MFRRLKQALLGRSLKNEELQGERLNVFWGLPLMASDAISSVAYAVEEILWVLVPAVGLLAYQDMFGVALAIIALLIILVFSYRQTIDSYPHGGGSYTVAKENLGEVPGLIAGAALIVGYILTVAVSTSSGAAAITSAFPTLQPWGTAITLGMIALMTIANLRGMKDSSRIFALPTYIFMASMMLMIVVGVSKVFLFGYDPTEVIPVQTMAQDATMFLLLRAFAAGCSGLTGVEAVSNAVPTFADPAQKNAKRVLMLLALCVFLIFGGISFLATLYHAAPTGEATILSQIAAQVFGDGFFFYLVQATTAVILVMAANTSYAGLPMLLSLIAHDGYAPRQFAMRGMRLCYSNGIVALSLAAAFLVAIYHADTHALIPLYAIGVFISFTLSQTGMLFRWFKERGYQWGRKAFLNGIGMVMTASTVVVLAWTKMAEGAWISLAIMAVLVIAMGVTRSHYDDVGCQLALEPEGFGRRRLPAEFARHTIVVVDRLNKPAAKAVEYARRYLGEENLVAFNVSIDEERQKVFAEEWEASGLNVPLITRYSPYRDVVGELISYVESEEHDSSPGDVLTVVIPQFVVAHWWQNIFHGQTAYQIRHRLVHDRHVAIITVPYVLDEDPHLLDINGPVKVKA